MKRARTRKKRAGKSQAALRAAARRAFTDATEKKVNAALIAAASNPDHRQFVAAARVLCN